MDTILRTGGNQRRGVLRVIAYHQLQGVYLPDYLRLEFCGDGMRTGGRGIEMDGVKYAAWYDMDGIQIAKGTTVNSPEALHITWEQAANRIASLLNRGAYQPQAVVEQAIPAERQACAEEVWYLHQDFNREQEYPFFVDEIWFENGGFPEQSEALSQAMENHRFLMDVLIRLDRFRRHYAADKSILRSHFHSPLALLERMAKLSNEPLTYPAAMIQPTEQQTFLTEDEVNEALRDRGTDRNLAFYSFFIHSHTRKEQEQFLRDRYGTGGHSDGISHADNSFTDYDGKGITFRRDKAEVKLNWNQCAKRLEELVLSGLFLSQ